MMEKLELLMGGFVRRWRGNSLRIAVKLSEELGEVAEAVALLSGDSRKVAKYPTLGLVGAEDKLAEELGDLIAVAVALGLSYGVDTKRIMEAALVKFKRFAEKYDTPAENPPG